MPFHFSNYIAQTRLKYNKKGRLNKKNEKSALPLKYREEEMSKKHIKMFPV